MNGREPGSLARALAELGQAFDDRLSSMRVELLQQVEALREEVRRGSRGGEEELLEIADLCRRAKVSRSQFYRWLGDPGLDLAGKGVVVRLPGAGAGRVRVEWRRFEAWLRERRES